ncbi:cellulose biosynthesis protein BcsQ [Pseudomonas sp. NPDC096917]|uniref:cellulose biosynthesis protein BcsQ n=1 Tax=Pseudomonas sp. NPDC096917 TaxID=3364483 RepID=UPI00383BB8EA
MIAMSLKGIRGGVGNSTTLAALSFALSALGQKVLVVDMCPENALGLHFNLDYAPAEGWARATLDQTPWYEHAWNIEPGLDILPYGTLTGLEPLQLDTLLRESPQLWSRRQASLAHSVDWVLFDLPQRLPGHSGNPCCEIALNVLNPDAASHVLLQTQRNSRQRLLVNRYDPASQLQRDLLLLWQHHYAQSLVPISLHTDEAMAEALARREPAGRSAPGSLIAQDIISLASWCLLRGGRLE